MQEIFQKLLDSIPDYKTFMTVDEMDESSKRLAEAHPECVTLTEIGRSRAGSPLYCLKIGSGPENALLFGCPHPNEPIGAMLLEHFSWKLAESPELQKALGYTCYIVKSWDCDATRLNEGWFKGPFTITHYARNFFRPAGHQQVDWTFPIDYKDLHFHSPIPETQAMMKLIDEIRPRFVYSLHNAGFGGVYWYVSHDVPEIREQMYAAANRQQVPLNLGEPEMPYCKAYAPAIYQKTSTRDSYDYMESNGVTDLANRIKQGDCSAEYAEKACGAFTLVTELPYFFDKRIDDRSESDRVRRDVVLEKLDFEDASNDFIRDAVAAAAPYVGADNPFKTTLDSFTTRSTSGATRKMVQENPEYAKKATVAEVFSNTLVNKVYKLLSFGVLMRMHEHELERAGDDAEKRAAMQAGREKSLAAFEKLAQYLEEAIDYEAVPIRKLVSIQLESGLLVMQYLREHR